MLRSGKERVFCAGANIRMLGRASHAPQGQLLQVHERDAQRDRGGGRAIPARRYICAINGTGAGGGYELALACDHIILADDGSRRVSLPEVPLLAVLPGTGGLTRLTDKRKVRRDLRGRLLHDRGGVKGKRAVDWRLVDEAVPNSQHSRRSSRTRAKEFAAHLDRCGRRPAASRSRRSNAASKRRRHRLVDHRARRRPGDEAGDDHDAGPEAAPPADAEALVEEGAAVWPLRCARELDDAILHLRFNEPELGTIDLPHAGRSAGGAAHEALLARQPVTHWLASEILLFWKRVLKRVDLTSRSLVALVEPGLLLRRHARRDRSSPRTAATWCSAQFEGDNRPPRRLTLGANFGAYPMANGLTRLETRFLGEPESVDGAERRIGEPLAAHDANELGLVTFASTSSTGRTKCASSWRSARASPPMP